MEEIQKLIAAMDVALDRTVGATESAVLMEHVRSLATLTMDEAAIAGQESYHGLAHFLSRMLFGFFQEFINVVESRYGFVCVNDRVEARFVVSEECCYRWFEGALLGRRARRQQFGCFFDFGEPRYCLHVEVGSTNLHIGLVKVWRSEGRIAITPMGEFDQARIEIGLNRHLPESWRLRPRGWGHRWSSIDCGNFQTLDNPRVALTYLAFADSPLAEEVLHPLVTALGRSTFKRTWAIQVFDRRQWFRFFIDGCFQRSYAGWRGYENNEPGSVQGMLDAFAFLLDHLDRAADLDAPYMMEMHRLCMNGVQTKNRKSTPGELRFLEAGFRFLARNSTLSSLCEVFALRRGDGTPVFRNEGFTHSTDEINFMEAYEALQARGRLRFCPWYPPLSKAERTLIATKDGSPAYLTLKEEIQSAYQTRMTALIDEYNTRIAGAHREIDILMAIARLARDMELLHPFPDGNGRLFPVALMCQLLMYFGYPPPIFHDPNIDAELSYAEFTAEMIRAMRNTLKLIENPEVKLFDYAIAEANQQDIDDFAFIARELSAKVDLLNQERDEGKIFATPDYLSWVTGGRWVNYHSKLRFTGADSHRTFGKGILYFGLAAPSWEKEGKSVESELRAVIDQGVSALVLDRPVSSDQYKVPVLVVKNLEDALKQLAHRTRIDSRCKTVLITGTEGKTGAKVQLHHLLSRQTEAHAVLNSANTEGPVLFSLINIRPSTQVEINEVSVGREERTREERTRLVSPDLCLFTNIGPNHMDMHKTIENVILAKSTVVEGLPHRGLAIVNSSNEYAEPLMSLIRKRRPDVAIHTYGTDVQDAGRLLSTRFDNNRLGWEVEALIGTQQVAFFLPLLPNHAPLASVGILLTVQMLGYDVVQAARDYSGVSPFKTMGQLLRLHLEDGDALFYDQSRRGGLHGMRAAFKDLDLLKVKGKVVALVGGISTRHDGNWTQQAHRELASLINASHIDRLYTIGNFMHYVHEGLTRPDILVAHHADHNDIALVTKQLIGDLQADNLLFIIGSGYLYLGRVADILLKHLRHSMVHSVRNDASPDLLI